MKTEFIFRSKISDNFELEKIIGSEKLKEVMYLDLKDRLDYMHVTETCFKKIIYNQSEYYQIEGILLSENVEKYKESVRESKEFYAKLEEKVITVSIMKPASISKPEDYGF